MCFIVMSFMFIVSIEEVVIDLETVHLHFGDIKKAPCWRFNYDFSSRVQVIVVL